MRKLIVVAIAILFTAPAWADHHEGKKSNKKICKMVKMEGHRTKTRVCQPQSFWDEQMKIEQDAIAGKPVDVQTRRRQEGN